MRWKNIHANIIPELTTVENRQFQIVPAPTDSLNPYANPWHTFGYRIDAPLRFGARGFTTILPGQSSVEARFPFIAAGASTENLWWGSGIRTGIVMSNNAAGIPQVYLRMPSPVRTPVGSWEARMLLGVLTESMFFDDDPGNDLRALSGAVVTVRPAFDSNMVLGASRVAFSAMPGFADIGRHSIDFVLTLPSGGREEITALFGEWSFPEMALALNWEWARLRLPSVRELLVAPQRTQGYTLGLKWARPIIDERTLLRVQAEATMLEQTLPPERSLTLTFYPSRRVPQGYTQRGQVIGAGTGPGSSSQWLAVELFKPLWKFGLTGGRIRWEDESYYFQWAGTTGRSHDVSLYAGVRGGVEWRRLAFHGEALGTRRLNYLFQTRSPYFFDSRFDVVNTTLNFEVSYRR